MTTGGKMYYNSENMKFRKLICLVLALAMCMGLAACGKTEAETAPTKQQTLEPQPEFVYSAQYKTLVEGTKNYLTVRGYTDEGFYVSSMELIGENIPAVHRHLSRRCREVSRQNIHSSALAGSVRAKEAHSLPASNLKAYIVNGTIRAVIFRKMLNFYHQPISSFPRNRKINGSGTRYISLWHLCQKTISQITV